MKIRTRIILIFVLLVGLGFYFLVRYVLENLQESYKEAVEETMIDQAHILASLVGIQIRDHQFNLQDLRLALQEAKSRSFQSKIYELQKDSVDQRVYVTNSQGIVVFDSDAQDEGRDYSNWRDVYLTLRGQYGARSTRANPRDPSTSTFYVAAPIYHNGKIFGVLTVAKPTRNIQLFIEAARTPILFAGALAALSVILLGIASSAWITHPLQKLTNYARSVRDGKREKFPKLSSPEIIELGFAFEEMRETLEGKKYIEQYVQHLTHEFKSPLTAIQSASELLQEETPPEVRQRFLGHIQNEVDRLKNMVERMLKLASLESRKNLENVELISTQSLVGEAKRPLEYQLQSKRIVWSENIPEDLKFYGEKFLWVQALQNILQNSLDFMSEGGHLTVEARLENTFILINIEDDGSGIPEFALSRIFEKFYSLSRPELGKKSTGLGLSFVQEVVELHDSLISIKNRKPSGVQVTFKIPAAL